MRRPAKRIAPACAFSIIFSSPAARSCACEQQPSHLKTVNERVSAEQKLKAIFHVRSHRVSLITFELHKARRLKPKPRAYGSRASEALPFALALHTHQQVPRAK